MNTLLSKWYLFLKENIHTNRCNGLLTLDNVLQDSVRDLIAKARGKVNGYFAFIKSSKILAYLSKEERFFFLSFAS